MQYKVKIDALHKYLSANNWTRESFNDQLEKVKKTFSGKKITLLIPTNENLEDYEFRISRLIKSLSGLEKESFNEVLDKVTKGVTENERKL